MLSAKFSGKPKGDTFEAIDLLFLGVQHLWDKWRRAQIKDILASLNSLFVLLNLDRNLEEPKRDLDWGDSVSEGGVHTVVHELGFDSTVCSALLFWQTLDPVISICLNSGENAFFWVLKADTSFFMWQQKICLICALLDGHQRRCACRRSICPNSLMSRTSHITKAKQSVKGHAWNYTLKYNFRPEVSKVNLPDGVTCLNHCLHQDCCLSLLGTPSHHWFLTC